MLTSYTITPSNNRNTKKKIRKRIASLRCTNCLACLFLGDVSIIKKFITIRVPVNFFILCSKRICNKTQKPPSIENGFFYQGLKNESYYQFRSALCLLLSFNCCIIVFLCSKKMVMSLNSGRISSPSFNVNVLCPESNS